MRKVYVAGGAAIAVAFIAIAGFVRSRAQPVTPTPAATTGITAAAPSGGPRGNEGGAIEPEITVVDDDRSFDLHVFSFPVARARFQVVDLGMSRELEKARREIGATLIVNGGFFDRQMQPEGLVVSEGRELSAKSETLGGGVLVVTSERADLDAAEGFALNPGASFAIQARPRLVVDDKRNIVHDDGRGAERTAICVRDKGMTLEVIIARGEQNGSGPTLALFADMLLSRGCEQALNLDGGPSTGVAWRSHDGAHALGPRGPLRHGVAIWVTE